ncbi:hypothetical protein BDV32DRAFT_17426 [Aspergillus pseudonomiae]|nr:hypothetical protein BDV32DRAFT_17426 [Aspergillus pseudonomiae]
MLTCKRLYRSIPWITSSIRTMEYSSLGFRLVLNKLQSINMCLEPRLAYYTPVFFMHLLLSSILFTRSPDLLTVFVF